MADGIIRLPVDGTGKRLDTEELTVAALPVHRERNQIAGIAPTAIAQVLDSDALGTDFALVVRDAPPVSPQVDYATSASLGAGLSVDLDATTIAAATTGKLMRVLVGSSVPCKWEIKTRDGAVQVVRAVIYTAGVSGGRPSEFYKPVTKEGITLAGAGVDENFRVTVTNLGTQVSEAADVHTTIEWDEV
jgi:hypothetical protein